MVMLKYLKNIIEKIDSHPNDAEKNKLLNELNQLLDEEQVLQLAKTMMNMADDPNIVDQTKQNSLERIQRFVRATAKPNQFQIKNGQQSKNFFPFIKNGQFLRMNISGVGGELDDYHYVIVWEVQDRRDQMLVIPTTSFKPNTTIESGMRFNIGHIDFLSEETVILLDQITSLSRKKINKHKFKDPSNSSMKPVKISKDQINRIKEGFRILGQGEITLANFILEKTRSSLPELIDYQVQFAHFHLPFKISSLTANKLVYYLYNDENNKFEINLHPTSLSNTDRKHFIRSWINATATYDSSMQLITSRTDAQWAAYQIMQTHYMHPTPEEKTTEEDERKTVGKA
ncbi:hypothetical protein [Rummeliibacillus pycnus]|uniref:hypothetical protein n=1 Tax=Rummeliibacillus pycnus TaxID=101070 RepID=UPI003D2D8683